MRSLLIVYSYHHHNTEKIARAMGDVLAAPVKTPEQVNSEMIGDCDLVGFGSGIYSGKHHPSLFDLVDTLPPVTGRNAFIFSTCGVPAMGFSDTLRDKNHSLFRKKLQSKGYVILGEFSCVGFNTNSFLRFFGGINKGRPDAEDFSHAEEFANNLKQIVEGGPSSS